MNRILNFINDLDMDDKTQQIIKGQIDDQVIQRKVREVCQLPSQEQILFMAKLNSRIKQITKPHKLLSVMLFVDTLLKNNSNLSLPNMQFDSLKQGSQKQQVILFNIVSYYHYFLKINNSNCYNRQTLNAQQQLYEAQNFCELSIKKILEFIKIDFIFIHGWNKLKQHQLLLREILKSMLERFRQDISILNLFVKNNIGLILQKTIRHPLVFQINYAYEKLLLINRNMDKLQKMAKMINCNVIFPRYEIDLQINRQIEFAMLERQSQRKSYEHNISVAKQQHQNGYLQDEFVMTTESFLLLNDNDQEE